MANNRMRQRWRKLNYGSKKGKVFERPIRIKSLAQLKQVYGEVVDLARTSVVITETDVSQTIWFAPAGVNKGIVGINGNQEIEKESFKKD